MKKQNDLPQSDPLYHDTCKNLYAAGNRIPVRCSASVERCAVPGFVRRCASLAAKEGGLNEYCLPCPGPARVLSFTCSPTTITI